MYSRGIIRKVARITGERERRWAVVFVGLVDAVIFGESFGGGAVEAEITE